MAASAQELDDFLGAKPRPRWLFWAKWGLVALGVLLLVLLVRSLFFTSSQPQYASETVARGPLTTTVSATGKLAPTNQVEVGSELSGLVTRVVVDVNDRVTAGQPLALIDPSRFQDAVNQSRALLAANQAQVEQARATLAQSQAQLQRLQEVYRISSGRVPARTELDQGVADRDRAVAGVRAAEANVVSARAQLSSNATQLTKSVIRSPVNGVVLARQIEVGATVAASFNTPTLFVIAEDLATMKLEVAIDEADVGSVRQGQSASFTVDAFPGRTFPATITRVDVGSNLSAQSSTTTTSTTTAQVVSYAAVLSVANAGGELRPGMTATADIVTSAKNNVLLVPNAALRFHPNEAGSAGSGSSSGGIAGALVPRPGRRPRSGGSAGSGDSGSGSGAALMPGGHATVYIKDPTGTPRPIRITIGTSNGSMTEVTGGDLTAGMDVITGQLAGTSARAAAGAVADRDGGAAAVASDTRAMPVPPGSADTSPLIALRGVTKTYGEGPTAFQALKGIDVDITAGDFVAVMGASGSGKSTTMNILGCLDVPTTGTFLFRGHHVETLDRDQRALLRRRYLGFVFQGFNLLARTTALENVELPLLYRGDAKTVRRETAMAALDQVGLKDWWDHTPAELSGGQQQRVAIARAIATQPDVLLADEPTGNLDSERSVEIMELLSGLNRNSGITVLMVTHEPDMAAFARTLVHFKDGLVERVDRQHRPGEAAA